MGRLKVYGRFRPAYFNRNDQERYASGRSMNHALLPPTVDVIVPSYRRPRDLERCLAGISRQTLAPQRVVVALRPDDTEGRAVAVDAPLHQLEIADALVGGQLAAIAAAFARTSATYVALTDDDAVPSPQWLERLSGHFFRSDDVGAVGGRDIVAGSPDQLTEDVGRLRWWGAYVGNHHRGLGTVREVDILKGVNMMFLADVAALPAPSVLRGQGSEIHWEILACNHLQAQGFRILYDPEATVDHFPAPRLDEDQRTAPSAGAVVDLSHNQFVATAGISPMKRPLHFFWGALFGNRATPGLVRALVAVAQRDRSVYWRLSSALRGRVYAYRHVGLRRRVTLVPARPPPT